MDPSSVLFFWRDICHCNKVNKVCIFVIVSFVKFGLYSFCLCGHCMTVGKRNGTFCFVKTGSSVSWLCF
jgi:hypothetical protein